METVDGILFLEAQNGNLRGVEKCLSMGANVLARTSHHTVLHSAVRSDNKTIVKLIVDKIKETAQEYVSVYIDAKDTEGDTPLMWTAENGFVNSARILLEFGADTEAKNSKGMTALHWAAKNNHKEVMKLLINKGASINVKDNDGLTPSDYARDERHGEIAGYLAFSVSEMFRKQGKYNDALRSYQEALDIQEVVLPPDHIDVLLTRHNMAVALASQGKHSEALELYKNVLDIQKRPDVLGPDHPDTLMTRYNMALEYINKGDSSEVLRIFREVLNIEEAELESDQPIPLTSSDVKIIQKKKAIVKSNLTEERDSQGNICFNSNDHQDQQESDEEFFELKCDKLETIKKNIREHLEDRYHDTLVVTGIDKGQKGWHFVCFDQSKKELFKEKLNGKADASQYGKILFSGWGENPPQNITAKVDDFFLQKVPNDLFVIREECENMRVYHYVLIDPDKRKMFLEQSKSGLALVRKIENCGKVLYSGLGQDPPEIISDRIVSIYFSMNSGNLNAALSVNNAGKNDWTSLHDAAYVGNLQVVKNLIDDGANVLVKDAVCGRTPLHIAAREGHTNVTELFLNKNINVNEADEKNWTPLHYAAWGGHFRTVKLLIHKGADIDAKEGTRGKKPIHIAAERGFMSIVNLLLRYGESVDVTDKGGRTSLYYASWKGHLNVVKSLADKGADINAENIYGSKPIHVAALCGCKNVIQYLLHRGANLNDSTKDNFTPLHNAASVGYLGVVKYLIKKGANIHARSSNGKTPSDSARMYGHKEIADLLDGLK